VSERAHCRRVAEFEPGFGLLKPDFGLSGAVPHLDRVVPPLAFLCPHSDSIPTVSAGSIQMEVN
jgi:hypothetical protein